MKKYENLFKQALIITSFFVFNVIAAEPVSYSPAELTAAATDWLTEQLPADASQNIKIDVNELDYRIGNKSCEIPLTFNLAQAITQRQNTIQIRCNTTDSWQLYVPVKIDEIIEAVILQQNISVGSVITADMLTTDTRERRFIRGSLVTHAEDVVGAKTKRSLSIGQILTFQDLCLVCKGDVVTISINDNSISVAATGVAQSDGSLGDTIKVMNQQSKRAINAEVIAVNLVKVKF
ncbi:flagellar basal body P-ring formation protein FlgA [Rheinheimera sp. D18]|uniref:flagellar basal body P-ring formation chaperone FlgA n=1 Tax=Rheinheimera sp. D18 TaxID=2545632 RepID=UPI00104E6D4C|nr:flagellar basal body P-ring formation chaperone FlgA [Rheinheimera sp. D18]QBL09922.1 flagellar basal body P-ring formation protein FlgA [Rheinheimera sp. D18]